MGEDRRPNVAGRTEERDASAANAPDEEQLKRDAKSLAKRAGVDGHEGRSPADIDSGRGGGAGEG